MTEYVKRASNDADFEKDYKDEGMTAEIDRLFALTSQHVGIDSQQTFEKVGPLLQQLFQMAQQMQPKPQLDPSDQAFVQVSVAETQRRAQRDQMDILEKQKDRETKSALESRQQEIDVALNAADNLTEERIKSVEVIQDERRLRTEQERAAMTALQSVKPHNPHGE